ncbi:hypothetical protein D3C81_1651460 [compost metagenome]
MDGKRYIIITVSLALQAVGIPAVLHIEGLDGSQGFLCQLLVIRQACLAEAHLHHNPEQKPVAIPQLVGIDRSQPGRQPLHSFPAKTFHQLPGSQGQGQAKGGHLHTALVIVSRRTPIFLMCGIGAVLDAFDIHIPQRACSTAGQ